MTNESIYVISIEYQRQREWQPRQHYVQMFPPSSAIATSIHRFSVRGLFHQRLTYKSIRHYLSPKSMLTFGEACANRYSRFRHAKAYYWFNHHCRRYHHHRASSSSFLDPQSQLSATHFGFFINKSRSRAIRVVDSSRCRFTQGVFEQFCQSNRLDAFLKMRNLYLASKVGISRRR